MDPRNTKKYPGIYVENGMRAMELGQQHSRQKIKTINKYIWNSCRLRHQPMVCLREVLRKGRNGQPMGWLQEINEIFINGGRLNFLEELLSDRPLEELLEEMRDVLKTIQKIWSEIERKGKANEPLINK